MFTPATGARCAEARLAIQPVLRNCNEPRLGSVVAPTMVSTHHAVADGRAAPGHLVAVPPRQLVGRAGDEPFESRGLPAAAHHGAGDSHDPEQNCDHPRPVAPAPSGLGRCSVHLSHILTCVVHLFVQVRRPRCSMTSVRNPSYVMAGCA
jgi:hypothetical protein